MMLKGIKAFEACWTALKQTYPTSKAENTLLVQSMGQFVDNYATQAEIRDALPDALKKLFDRLIDAYLNGYDPSAIPEPAQILVGVTATPQSAAFSQQAVSATAMQSQPTASFAAGLDPTRMTAATLAAAALRRQNLAGGIPSSEVDTLVVEDL